MYFSMSDSFLSSPLLTFSRMSFCSCWDFSVLRSGLDGGGFGEFGDRVWVEGAGGFLAGGG
jgi:hypothetical protein